MNTPSDIEIAWFAGLFDGEGCVVLVPTPNRKRGRVYNMRVTIGSTYLPVLIRIKNMWGVGNIITCSSKHKPFWKWDIYGDAACNVLELSLPFLFVKKSEAKFGTIFQHWKKKDISIWGRTTRPATSYQKEKGAKELLPKCRSVDTSIVEQQIQQILLDRQPNLFSTDDQLIL